MEMATEILLRFIRNWYISTPYSELIAVGKVDWTDSEMNDDKKTATKVTYLVFGK